MSFATSSLVKMSLRTIVPRYSFPRNNVPHDNCSLQQLLHTTIVASNNYSSAPLKWSFAEVSLPDDQNQGDGGAEIVAIDHPDDPASSVSLQMVIFKEDCPQYDQNQRDGGARIIANDHLDDPASSLLLHSFANGHLQIGRSSRWG